MPEELRIVVVDQGGPAGGAVAGRGARAGTTAGVAAGGALRNRVGPPPLSPSVPAPPRGGAALGVAAGFAGIRAAQGLGAKAAGGNVLGAVGGAVALGATALASPVGLAIAGVTAGFVIAGIAVKKFADTIESQTDKLAGFSLALSIAQSQTDIRRQAALRRRAQQIGPSLAAAEALRSQFETRLTDLNTKMLEVLLEILSKLDPLFQFLLDRLDAANELLGDGNAQVQVAMAGVVNPQAAAIIAIWKLLTREVEKREDDNPDDPFAEEFMKMSAPRDAAGPSPFQKAGIPLAAPGV